MDRGNVKGLRIFLLTLLEIEAGGTKENCEAMEIALPTGVATTLYKKYQSLFDTNGFDPEDICGIDEYYRQWSGCAEGNELRKYACTKENGICLVIALALNEIY